MPAAGISSSTYYRWMSRGAQEPGSEYAAFRDAVLRAEAEAEVHAVAILRRAMGEDWRAAIAYLERRHPHRWRAHHQTELVGKAGGPIQTQHTTLDLARLTDAELADSRGADHSCFPPRVTRGRTRPPQPSQLRHPAWPLVDPSASGRWHHIDLICDYLQAVARGEVRGS